MTTRIIQINTKANPCFIQVEEGGGASVTSYATYADFPAAGTVTGQFAWDEANGLLYLSIGGVWNEVSVPAVGSAGMALFVQGGIPAWRNITQDDIHPGLTATLSCTNGGTFEAGRDLVNPQFTVTHSSTPDTATMTDYLDTQSIIPASALSVGYGGAANTFPARTYSDPGTLNASRTNTYNITAGGVSFSVSVTTVTWWRKAFYGLAVPAAYDAAFIGALSSNRLQSGYTQSYAFGAGSGTQYSYIALPTGWGNPTTFRESVSGLPVSFTKVASAISVTNAYGATYTYELWMSPQANTSAFTYSVS